jgi:hypothetical protein
MKVGPKSDLAAVFVFITHAGANEPRVDFIPLQRFLLDYCGRFALARGALGRHF